MFDPLETTLFLFDSNQKNELSLKYFKKRERIIIMFICILFCFRLERERERGDFNKYEEATNKRIPLIAKYIHRISIRNNAYGKCASSIPKMPPSPLFSRRHRSHYFKLDIYTKVLKQNKKKQSS